MDQTDEEHLQLLYQIVTIGKRDLPLAPNEKVGFTMVMLRMMAFLPEPDPVTALKKSKTESPQLKTVKAKPVKKLSTGSDKKVHVSSAINTNQEWKKFVS